MIRAEIEGGQVLEFPDGTPPEVIQRTVQQTLGIGARAPQTGAPAYTDEAGAGIGTALGSSFISDPQSRMRYFAQRRGIPVERYRMEGGRVAYRGDDGQWHFELPTDTLPGSITEFGRGLASGVGPAVPAVTGGVAGVLSAPMIAAGPAGLAGSMAIAGAGQAAGQAAREGVANYLVGQEPSPRRIGMAGAEGALGQGIGAGLTALTNRHLATDFQRTLDPARAAENARVNDIARQYNVDLTPAERLNLSSLRAQQRYLNNAAPSQDIMNDFYQRRTQQVQAANDTFLDRLSLLGREEAGDMAQRGGQAAMDRVAAERAARASPLYQRAFQENPSVNMQETASWLDEQIGRARGPIRQALTQARSYLYTDGPAAEGGRAAQVLDDSLGGLHQAKLAIDALIQGRDPQGRSIDTVSRGLLQQLQRRVLGAMDEASPTYQQARAIFAADTPGVVQVREGLSGALAGLDQQQLFTAAQRVFQGGPREIARAREQFTALNPSRDGVDGEAAWNGIIRGFLEDVFDRSSRQSVAQYGNATNVAGREAATLSDPRTAERLRAAMTPQQFSAFQDLMTLMQRAGSVRPIGSDTEFNRLITETERSAARPLLGQIARNLNPAQALRTFDDWLTNRAMGQNAAAVAEIITSPDAMRQLRAIRALPPGSVAMRVGLGHLLTTAGFAGGRALMPAPDQPGVGQPSAAPAATERPQ